VASLMWSLALIYISFSTTDNSFANHLTTHYTTTDHMTTDLGQKKFPHMRRDVIKKAAAIVTEETAPKQNKLPQLIKKNPNFNIGKESNRLITTDDVMKQTTSRAPLFISDKPVDVKGVLSWKEAMETHNAQEEQEDKDGFNRHAFNQFASDKLGYFREIPDTRHSL